jgi:hypothetical protein
MEEQAAMVEEASTEYVGRWNRLVSTTNWEKGRIIAAWREALHEAGAPASLATDEAWSRQVGNVTPQHVGRLRRVCERFGEVCQQYKGLYWSHFQAALDWTDAEMYLEGAVQNGWSISEMRNQRWEALGGQPDQKPRDEDIVASEWDEDVSAESDNSPSASIASSVGEVHGVDELYDDEPRADEFDANASHHASPAAASVAEAPAAPTLRPFESLPPLPADLNEAFELFKLAILAHKITAWQEIARDDVLSVLESLKQLALAPAE